MFEKRKKELCYKTKGLFLLVVFSTLVASSVILSVVFANLASTPSIAINDVIYEVNDQGDLTIQVSGIMNGITATNCDFGLQIPDTFEVDTLADGTPIIEMLSNGSALEIAEDGNNYSVVFALRTYNTTVLPKKFYIDIISATIQHSAFITPKWPQQESTPVGGGAGITSVPSPRISSFYAYDSYKATTEHVKTYIYNPAEVPRKVDTLKYKIFADDYYWEDWTPAYSANYWIGDKETVVNHDYLDYIFTATSGKMYTLSKSEDYRVTKATASGTDSWGSWTDSIYPTFSQGQFAVTIESGTHPVFVVHMVDQAFRDNFDEDGYFDHIEDVDFELSDETSTDLLTEFDIDFISTVFTWEVSSDDPVQLFIEIQSDAKDVLKLSNNWDKGSSGTRWGNHGFDMLFGHSWQYNSQSHVVGKGMYNLGVAVRGYIYWLWEPYIGICVDVDTDLVTLHEVLHTYQCGHKDGEYIMNDNVHDSGYNLHSSSENTLVHQKDLYDGVKITSEGFEQGDPNSYGWTEVSGGYNFVQSTDHEVGGSYSGKHYGGSGTSAYQMDQWDTAGTHVDCHLSGYVYSSHYNHYASSDIYLYYKDTSNYVYLSFYYNYVRIYSKINDGAETYTDTSTESWHQKTWYFSLTLQDNAVSGYVYEVDGDDYYALNEHTYTGTLSSGRYIALKSRVGAFSPTYYDNLEFIKL